VTGLRILAFGELASETCGVIWTSDESGPARLAVRVGQGAAVLDAELERIDDAAWQLTGDSVSLIFRPAMPPIASQDPEGQLERQDQLCAVAGALGIEGHEIAVGCLGWTTGVRSETALEQLDSVRFLAAWLEPQAGFSLTALRPRKASGHEADVVAAVVVEEAPQRVLDPRFSTTYTEDGRPARAGVELWLEAEAAESSDDEAALEYPRRAAGEVKGRGIEWSQDKLELHASLLHWHSHGHEGAGIYVLGRRR
jgi:hypothetical protein